MSVIPPDALAAVESAASAVGRRRSHWPIGLYAGVMIVAVVVLAGLLAPWLAPDEPTAQDLTHALAGPSATHWFGTDALGRDILTRILYGARFELSVVIPTVLVALAMAFPIGISAGYLGRWVDRVITMASDTVLTFPSLVVAIGVVAVLGTGTWPLIITLLITQTPPLVRYIRGFTSQVAGAEFMVAARATGSSSLSIMARHVTRNIVGNVVVVTSLFASEAVLIIAALGFLGIGVQPPAAEWGTMLSEGRIDFMAHPHVMVFPGLAIAVLILGFNLASDGLRDRLDTSR